MRTLIKTGEMEVSKSTLGRDVGEGRNAEVQVPASTSNLGSGFDCCGLALKLYLSVQATVKTKYARTCEVHMGDEEHESGNTPRGRGNLIYRAMHFVAERERIRLPPLRLDVHNDIPLA